MRMDVRSGETAGEWLNQAEEAEMSKVFWRLGEERYARRIARQIVNARPLETTSQLVVAIERGQPSRDKNKHGATRVFQAIRMHINQESEELIAGLSAAFEILAVGGRLAVISFQSIDDRCVKQTFKHLSKPAELPRRLPVRADTLEAAPAKFIVKRKRASVIESRDNPRARTALLRVVEKVHE
jgi:16S rRNA (cytosine1402-N4)-methyltransferase